MPDVYSKVPRPVLSETTPVALMKALKLDGRKSMGDLCIDALKLQLKAHETHQKEATQRDENARDMLERMPKVGGKTVLKLREEERKLGVEKVVEMLMNSEKKNLEKVAREFSYPVVRELLTKMKGDKVGERDENEGGSKRRKVKAESDASKSLEIDIDEWILKDEDKLRTNRGMSWNHGLVALSCDMPFVLPTSHLAPDKSSKVVPRPSDLPHSWNRATFPDEKPEASPDYHTEKGFFFLDQQRSPSVSVQLSSEAYKKAFDEMTFGQLEGLDWNNVFVAGGICLGALFCVDSPGDKGAEKMKNKWKGSDVDIYLYGMGPKEANKKIEEIFKVFKKNLLKAAKRAGLKGKPPSLLVLRNSRTITFLPSAYPLRRFQIILKLVADPKQVLLNFDLDICAIGFDGEEAWMLPRMVRCLETGYTIFTTNLYEGHYLGERRASQEHRVFKYAGKGYGIRILPSYLQSLPKKKIKTSVDNKEEIEVAGGDRLVKLRKNAKTWTDELLKKHLTSDENERDYFKLAPGQLPTFSHRQIDDMLQRTSEPADRSCLSGFELFMRHIALWEKEQAGEIKIDEEEWATTVYTKDQAEAYDETPRYPWNENFKLGDFIRSCNIFNRNAENQAEQNLSRAEDWGYENLEPRYDVSRLIHGSDLKDVTQNEIVSLVYLPSSFVHLANEKITAALRKAGFNSHPPVLESHDEKEDGSDDDSEDMGYQMFSDKPADAGLYYWKVTNVTALQQIDRRIDECHEIIWSCYHANSHIQAEERDRITRLRTQLSKRAIRLKPEDELKSFGKWVSREPTTEGPWFLQTAHFVPRNDGSR